MGKRGNLEKSVGSWAFAPKFSPKGAWEEGWIGVENTSAPFLTHSYFFPPLVLSPSAPVLPSRFFFLLSESLILVCVLGVLL